MFIFSFELKNLFTLTVKLLDQFKRCGSAIDFRIQIFMIRSLSRRAHKTRSLEHLHPFAGLTISLPLRRSLTTSLPLRRSLKTSLPLRRSLTTSLSSDRALRPASPPTEPYDQPPPPTESYDQPPLRRSNALILM